MEKDYTQLLEQLINQEIESFEIHPEEFMAFREIWRKRPDRMDFVGEAGFNGIITYRFKPEERS